MKNEFQEFFHGENEQEIENEKRKKNSLIKLFPNLMGNKDQTEYVLHKNDCSKKNYCFEEIPDTFVISNKSEKSKQQEMYLTPKTYDFENNIATPFVGNGFMQANPFSKFNYPKHTRHFAIHDEYKKVRNTIPRGTVEKNLKPDSININNHPDLLWSNKIQERTYYNNKPGIYGSKPIKDYSKEINILKSKLPQRALNILNELGTEIRVFDNLHYIDNKGNIHKPLGTYKSNKITLDSKHVNIGTLLAETIHAVQNYLGMPNTSLSHLEFQEHVIKDLYNIQNLIQKGYSDCASGISTSSSNYMDFLESIFYKNGVLDLKIFLMNINSFYNDFQNNYRQSNSYQEQKTNYFNYNWISFLNILGIEYK